MYYPKRKKITSMHYVCTCSIMNNDSSNTLMKHLYIINDMTADFWILGYLLADNHHYIMALISIGMLIQVINMF